MIPGVNRQRGPRGGSRQLRPAEAGLVAAAAGPAGLHTEPARRDPLLPQPGPPLRWLLVFPPRGF